MLDTLQKINNFLYDMFGLKNFVLKFQIYINTKRAEQNKPDTTKFIIKDEGEIFSQ